MLCINTVVVFVFFLVVWVFLSQRCLLFHENWKREKQPNIDEIDCVSSNFNRAKSLLERYSNRLHIKVIFYTIDLIILAMLRI